MNRPDLDFAALFDKSPTFMCVLRGPRHVFEVANEAYLRLVERADILGKPVREALPDIVDQGFYELLDRVYATGERHVARSRAIRLRPSADAPEGERVLDFIYEPVRAADGTVEGILVQGHDVTEQARAKAALEASEERYRRIVEGADDFAIITQDEKGLITSWNTGAERLMGYTEAEALGRPGAMFFTPEDRAKGDPDREMARALSEGRAVNERWHLRKDGTRFWGSGLMMRADGPGRGYIKMFRDRTAEHEGEARLRASEARLRAALDIETVGAIYIDAEGRLVDANDAFLRMAGHGRADLEAGRLRWQELTPPEWMADSERAWAELTATGRTTPYEKEYLRPDGSRWWALFAAKLLPDGTAFEVVLDITARKAAEARRAALARIADRLRDLEEPAAIAFAAAEELGRALGVGRVGYGTMDHEAETLRVERDWTAPGVATLAGVHRLRDYGSIVEDLKRGEPTVIPDTGHDPRTGGPEATAALAAVDVRAVVNVPVLERGRLVALLFANDARPRDWSPEDLDLIREVAGRTRTAVERARAVAALRQANETLEARVAQAVAERDRMWATSPDLMLVIGFDGVLRRVNPAWTTILGYAPEEMVGRHVTEFVVPEDHAATAAAAGLAAHGGQPRVVNRYRHKDGSLRWISWTAAQGGDATYATGRDITAERERQARLDAAEAARREADALYRAYFENTAEALFVIGAQPDGGFTIEELNPAHQAATGLDVRPLRGRRVEEQLPPEVARAVAANYRRAVALGRPTSYREVLALPAGRRHWDTVLVPVRDRAGRVTRLIGSARDITAQVEAEEQLRQAQKMDAMGQLTGGVAHDFNNLLTPILAVLDRLQRQGLGEPRERRLIAGAAQSAERARTLVQRLLAFARRQPLQPTAVDLGALVEGMADLVRSTTGPRVEVEVAVAPGLPPALADANQVEMAILNLAVNARDAMPEGGTLRLSADGEAVGPGHATGLPPGRYLRLSVADTGTGMDEATLARAVEPFFSTKALGQGTGLGLSMVHGLAAQLGGALRILSAPGRGTTAELWLPATEQGAADRPGPPPEGERAPAGGTVLLVDDEDLVRASTAALLAELGFGVVEAASAGEALDRLDGGLAPDLVITDHLMPGMHGTDLARLLRARRPGLPVLVISGYAGVDGIAPDLPRLAKPFRRADLGTAVADLLARR
ncbi:PAS domain S-box protein [Rubellimicrobium aerolatum]|uniref:histidine kinase n=1 Tax=Rubellimicrobium aerolatum TaxID=490979 RepID=A0ABW0SAD4_9RHOB|nr:PAS domain S-box protein [Rubellimicrobium aerolatum]MBP1805218.1 PAS domain S-box-containing protein [Rubellimicrobium aerolatum]